MEAAIFQFTTCCFTGSLLHFSPCMTSFQLIVWWLQRYISARFHGPFQLKTSKPTLERNMLCILSKYLPMRCSFEIEINGLYFTALLGVLCSMPHTLIGFLVTTRGHLFSPRWWDWRSSWLCGPLAPTTHTPSCPSSAWWLPRGRSLCWRTGRDERQSWRWSGAWVGSRRPSRIELSLSGKVCPHVSMDPKQTISQPALPATGGGRRRRW